MRATDDEDDEFDRIRDEGEEVYWQDWDSGGPGAGGGRVSVYVYQRQFYVFHDAGIEGPYPTQEEAVEVNGVAKITDATKAIWDSAIGYIFKADGRTTRKLS